MVADLRNATDEDLVLELMRRKKLTQQQAMRIMAPKQDLSKVQAEADEWIAKNPELFSVMSQKALDLAKEGKRFSFRLISEEVRWLVKSSGKHDTFKIKDGLMTYIGVRICQAHPEVKPFIKTRKRIL